MRTNEKNEISAWDGDWEARIYQRIEELGYTTYGTTCVRGRVVPMIISRTSCPRA
jgi:hypothetical protein